MTKMSIPPPTTPSDFVVTLRASSAASNLALLLFLPLHWWYRRRCRRGTTPSAKTGSDPFSFYFPVLLGCLLQGAFHLFFFLFSISRLESSSPHERWPGDLEALAVPIDFAARALVSGLTAAYLHLHLYPSHGTKVFPGPLRAWWGLGAVLSTAVLVLDLLVQYADGDRAAASVVVTEPLLVSDVGSFLLAVFLAVCGFAGKRKGDDDDDDVNQSDADDEASRLLREPLLNGNGDAAGGVSPKKTNGSKSLFSGAGFLSVLTFYWLGPLLSVGYRKTLDLEDVPDLDEADSIYGTYPTFKSKLDDFSFSHGVPGSHASGSRNDDSDGAATNKNTSSTTTTVTTLALVKALVFMTWGLILLTGLYALVYTVASYVGPYLIDYFVQYLNGNETYTSEGYVLVSAFVIAKLVECLSQRHWFFRLQQVGVRARAVLVASIYQKGLTLSGHARQGRTTGEIINLMSVDAERIGLFSWYLHDLWMVPVQVGLALVILYTNLGLASVAALIATVVVMMANYPLGKLQERYQEKLMEAKDTRMKSTSEVLRNMRILKLQAWEMKFLSRIMELRDKETNWLKRYVYTSAVVTFVFWGAPTLVSVVTFGACIVMGIPLQSGKVLSALATFRVLQEPIYNLPDTIAMVIQTKVSLDRIATFLRLDDLQTDVVEKLPAGTSEIAVQIQDASFSWDPSSAANPTLKDLNLQIRHGMRVAVCGTVGSGKSSLLSCILGELHKPSGTVRICGTTAYVAQSPWIQSGKIEDNILFGKEMDRERYDRVLEACSLKKDLEILPFGDQTVIGERGINLSGGQKQRVQIARALYQDADIFLFDDPFSAVDAHTGTHLFKECLLGLLASKTVIFVTHQVEFLPCADLILVMKHGRIAQAGKYNDILSSGTHFEELVGAHEEALSALDSTKDGILNVNITVGDDVSDINTSSLTVPQSEEETNHNQKKDNAGEATGQNGQLVQEEEREKGKVGFEVYWKYITTSYNGALVLPILLAQILFQGLQIGSNYWMAWAAPVSEDVTPPVDSLVLIYVYVALAIGSSLCVLVRALLLVTAGYKTATLLFNKMHISIFRAPMSFFDSTPTGRILNRASTDQNEVDTSMANQIGSFAFSIIQLFGIVAVMSQVAWQVFAIFIPVIAASIWYQNYYIATARELARLSGVCKAPIIQHFSESLSGSSTIRSFNQGSRFVKANFHLSDAYSSPKFHNATAREWLCFRLDMLSSMTFAFSLIFLTVIPRGTIDPGIAGLAVTYGLNLNMIQSWVIWNLCNLENKIISVERILQYMSVPTEPPLTIEANKPDANWPVQGEVDICDLQVRYAPHMPYVLKGITCTFNAGAKTGIVGRTGSGKSTLIQTLFRIVEPTVGQITIDGINILTIGLHDLRSRLSIIPQDPTMFEGSIRSNLDPLEEYSDEQIWEALDKCQLGDEVRRKEGKLDSAVTENGENWSMGQRQLVCLGRVLLKKSKVLVLDEATASVDTATDNLIQKTLREQFSETTVITIAHRITSVLDSDMVLLLDGGRIAEYDSPSKLLEEQSSFAKLVSEYTLRLDSNLRNS